MSLDGPAGAALALDFRLGLCGAGGVGGLVGGAILGGAAPPHARAGVALACRRVPGAGSVARVAGEAPRPRAFTALGRGVGPRGGGDDTRRSSSARTALTGRLSGAGRAGDSGRAPASPPTGRCDVWRGRTVRDRLRPRIPGIPGVAP